MDPFGPEFDVGAYRDFFRGFRRLKRGEAPRPLDVLKQRAPQAHVSIALTGGYALETRQGFAACRVPIRDLERLMTGVYRLRCLQAS